MTGHSQSTDDTAGVSPSTARAAAQAATALEQSGITVRGVQFDYGADSFRVLLANGDVSGGPNDFTPQGIGGGNIKEQ